jgi:hypothetical protein
MGAWTDAIQMQIESLALGRSSIKTITLTLTSAQLLSIGTVPIQVLPSPGLNKSYIIHDSQSHYRFVTTAYSTAGMGAMRAFGNIAANGYWVISNLASILTQVADAYNQGSFFSSTVLAANLVNLPMLLGGANATNPTLGDGLLTTTIYYSIVDGSIQ